ncbi:MAG: GIY-YIG nuclease family protein [Pseudomonadales bacterium]|nr:GIY-YIG nuclease family protein [Pseudomonadales bacterium]
MSGTAVWSVYLIRCGDGSLYTGISTDVTRRLAEHQQGAPKGARYLRGRGPLQLLFQAEAGDRASASRLEWRVKRLSREDKLKLVTGQLALPS